MPDTIVRWFSEEGRSHCLQSFQVIFQISFLGPGRVRIKPSQSRFRLAEMLHASIAQWPHTSFQWPATLWRRNYALRVKSYLVSLPDILAPGLLETEKLCHSARTWQMMWTGCYHTAIHPLSGTRTTRGWKINREIVNCTARKLSQRNFREKCVLPSPREAE